MSGKQRIVIVTGAAGGIGRALAELSAADGETVIGVDLAGIGLSEIVAGLPGQGHLAFEVDIASEQSILAFYAEVDRRFDHIDVLYNNAAMGPTMTPTVDTTADLFRKTLAVNLVGPFVMAREAAKRMRPGGAIVNTASLAGVLGNPKRNAYSASKAGLISFTKSLACEWASRGVRVCAIAPGYVRTPMVGQLEKDGKVDLSAVRRRVPIGRMARPDEMARPARFLGSPRARYITGSVFGVDGGWLSFNQPGDAHPPVDGTPADELQRPDNYVSTGRIVLVTGGANGIGAATARRFAENGDTVIIADKDAAGAVAHAASLGSAHIGLPLDVVDEASVIALFEKIRAHFGRLDLLVNNAAISDTWTPGIEQTPGDLNRVLEVNLTGAFLCAREAVRAMTRGGMIVNLGSINTFLPFVPRHAYGASKAGIDILTRCMAAELGPQGIRTATVAPGYIRTPGVAGLEGKVDFTGIRRRIPMGDLGRPEDIADAIFFLASPDASYVSGTTLYVDGGWTSFGNAGFASDLSDTDTLEAAE